MRLSFLIIPLIPRSRVANRVATMKIHFPGVGQCFNDVKLGQAFLSNRGDSFYFFVKAQRSNNVIGAIQIDHPDKSAKPQFRDSIEFSSNLLTLPDMRFVPSIDHLRFGNFTEPGNIYLFDDGKLYLAFVYGDPGAPQNYLLNVETGEAKTRSSFRSIPNKIIRWALVIENWG